MKREIRNAQQSTRLLSVANAQDIKPGYCWYEDNTFSKEIITGKPLKAIVVLVRYNIIYGDVFLEERCDIKHLKETLQRMSSKANLQLSLLSLSLHRAMFPYIKEINHALQKCEKSIWIGKYWTDSGFARHDLWACSYPEGVQGPAGYGNHALRPVMCLYAK